MRPVVPAEYTDAFDQVALTTHHMVTWVDVLFGGEVVESRIPVVSGSIRAGRDQATAILNCAVADPDRIPGDVSDWLAPDGHELRVWRGVTLGAAGDPVTFLGEPLTIDGKPITFGYIGGPVAAVALGTFPIQRSSISTHDRLSRVIAHDRSQFVSDAGFEETYVVEEDTNVAEALEALILSRYPAAECVFPTTDFKAPLLTWDRGDPWRDAARKLAESAGWRVKPDGYGRFTAAPVATIDTPPVATLASGLNVIRASVDLDRAPAYNRVIVRSNNSSTGEMYEGVATIEGGRYGYDTGFGRKTLVINSEYPNSDEQAQAMAEAKLAEVGRIVVKTDWAAVPNPRFEEEDVIAADIPELGIQGPHIIDTIEIGLSAEVEQTGTNRVQQLA